MMMMMIMIKLIMMIRLGINPKKYLIVIFN